MKYNCITRSTKKTGSGEQSTQYSNVADMTSPSFILCRRIYSAIQINQLITMAWKICGRSLIIPDQLVDEYSIYISWAVSLDQTKCIHIKAILHQDWKKGENRKSRIYSSKTYVNTLVFFSLRS